MTDYYTFETQGESQSFTQLLINTSNGCVDNPPTLRDYDGCVVNGNKIPSSTQSIESESLSSETVENGFNVAPVPFTDQVTLRYEFDYTSNVKIQFFDLNGSLLRTYKDKQVTNGDETQINLDFALKANTAYIIRVETDRDSFSKTVMSGN